MKLHSRGLNFPSCRYRWYRLDCYIATSCRHRYESNRPKIDRPIRLKLMTNLEISVVVTFFAPRVCLRVFASPRRFCTHLLLLFFDRKYDVVSSTVSEVLSHNLPSSFVLVVALVQSTSTCLSPRLIFLPSTTTKQAIETMPPQNRNETGGMEVGRPIHRIVSRGELSVASEGNESTNGSGPSTPTSPKEYRVRKSSLIGYVECKQNAFARMKIVCCQFWIPIRFRYCNFFSMTTNTFYLSW
jgi:hypothetical protein